MKKFVSVLLSFIACTVLLAVGCNGGDGKTHTTHNWSSTYTEDGDRHYQTCDGCTEKNYENHSYQNGVCKCGKQQPDTSIAATGVTLNKNTLTLEVGGTETLIATVTPDNATDKSVTWESDKTNIATVDNNGKVTAVAEGTAIITVKTANNKTAQCTVTVNAAVVPVTGVTLDKTELTLEVDGTETLTATVAPDNATDKTVTYSVEPAGVVTVDNSGNVTAVAEGTATITATAANDKTATCTVTVNAPLTNAEVLKFLNDNVLMEAAKGSLNSGWEVSEMNVTNATWFITKDGKNITGANLIFNYLRRDTATYVTLCNIEFGTPLSIENIKNGTKVNATYTQIYAKAINPTIQTEHAALTNAICDKLFGEKQNATRYIVQINHDAMIGWNYPKTNEWGKNKCGFSSIFNVIEITNTGIQTGGIFICADQHVTTNDDLYIKNLNDGYYENRDTENYNIQGELLQDDNLPFGRWNITENTATNEEIIAALNKNCVSEIYNSLLPSKTVTDNQIKNAKWYAVKDNKGNILSAEYSFYYQESATRSVFYVARVGFFTPLTYEDICDIQNGNTKSAEYSCCYNTESYDNLQTTHSTVVDAIFNSTQEENSERFLLGIVTGTWYNDYYDGQSHFIDAETFVVLKIDDDKITHKYMDIKSSTSDAGYVANINNKNCSSVTSVLYEFMGERLVAE